jgi:twitching motility protein PilT
MPAKIEDYLNLAVQSNATDLHLTAGAPATMRVNGELRAADEEKLGAESIKNLARELLSDERMNSLAALNEVDFALDWKDLCRFRGNAYIQRGSIALALRIIPYQIPKMADLRLPPVVQDIVNLRQGLVLVTGPTGSGKSTTQAAMIDWINENRACHIVTIEDPLEYLHRHKRAIVDQREVGIDTLSFSAALRASLREDPDVVLLGEMRDLETIKIAVTVAETGHLVFATLHTNDTAQAIDRVTDVFPGDQQQQIRVQLATTLAAVIYQQLLPLKDRDGQVAAFEVLLANTAVRNMIREGQTRQIRNVISTSSAVGMQTLERSLSALVAEGLVSHDEAVGRAGFPNEVTAQAKR